MKVPTFSNCHIISISPHLNHGRHGAFSSFRSVCVSRMSSWRNRSASRHCLATLWMSSPRSRGLGP